MRSIGVVIVSRTPFDFGHPILIKVGPDGSAGVADAAFPDGRHDPQHVVQPDDIPTGSATRVLFPPYRRWLALRVYSIPDDQVIRGTASTSARRSCSKGSAADLTHVLRSFPSL
jgi:hypothetical protein